ncbi:DsbA family oxidoreductase [Xylophilus rhododendri]|uniref:DsbA family oxidoreductase n=1 Tax=Xylophilus rhododendri TaxID=2697032 RepID=A0A857J576_9BURK|nr:DsbA family oxidoreductase [Xylophilus rhododendri]QHI98249.1 DsbA family oxidoreductase [Xylophilus rhododendri]
MADTSTPNTPIRIDFVSDVACPWCAVGLGGLERALEQLQGNVPVELHFQPFELNPQMPPEGEDVTEHIGRKYGSTPAQQEASRAAIRERGAAVGFAFNPAGRGRIWNTFDAHRLLYWAGEQGRQRELKHALLKAYHGEALNPGDPAVLLACAVEAGLDADGARTVIESDRYTEEVREREQFYQQHGITAVPSVILGERYLIQGGQPPEAYVEAIRQLARERASA